MARIKVPILETERLILRSWRRKDAPALYAYAKNPNVGPNAGWKPHASVGESRQIITQLFQQNMTWAITLKEPLVVERETGSSETVSGSDAAAREQTPGTCNVTVPADTPIGSIGFEPDAYRPRIASRELGYSLSEDCWRQGIMTEAARRLIRYGFEEMRLLSVMIRTGEANQRSRRVIEKCGFQYEGTLRQCYRMYNNEIRDSRVYSLLREEYEELAGLWE